MGAFSMSRFVIVVFITFAVIAAFSSAQTPAPDATFAPFEQWKNAVLAGDSATLKMLYSTDPAAQIRVKSAMQNADADTGFWLGLKARSMKVDIVRLVVRPERASVIFRAEVVTGLPNGQTVHVTDAQGWRKQGDQWRLVGAERNDEPRLKHPSDMKKNIYPADADAHAEIKEAEEKAAAGHKRVLLVFGANWCFDCHVLDLAFQRPDFVPTVSRYEIVHVDIGDDGKKNNDIAQEFQVPLEKGIPALAVIDGSGKLLVSQKNGEFEDARAMTPEAILEFLNKWKAE
jgi:thioredoxin 1